MAMTKRAAAALAVAAAIAGCGAQSAQQTAHKRLAACESRVTAQDAATNQQRPYPLNAQAEKALDGYWFIQTCES